jgi:hypothetical protein
LTIVEDAHRKKETNRRKDPEKNKTLTLALKLRHKKKALTLPPLRFSLLPSLPPSFLTRGVNHVQHMRRLRGGGRKLFFLQPTALGDWSCQEDFSDGYLHVLGERRDLQAK